MPLAGCAFCLKYIVFAFNFVFWLLGCGLMGLGLWAKFHPESFIQIGGMAQNPILNRLIDIATTNYEIYLNLLITLGAIIMIISFFGCCGAIKESKMFLGIFFFCILILFTALLAVSIYSAVHKHRLKHHAGVLIQQQIEKAEAGDDVARRFLDHMQTTLSCCGAMLGGADYKDKESAGCQNLETQESCAKTFYNLVKMNKGTIVAAAISAALIMILGMVFSILLCCSIREQT